MNEEYVDDDPSKFVADEDLFVVRLSWILVF
jgi:hypothetical protein